MNSSRSLENDALKLCRQALHRPASRSSAKPGPIDARAGRLEWLLPELAKLIVGQHQRPACDFAWTVRRFVDEYTFLEDADDAVLDDAMNDEAQSLVEASLRVHRAVHHKAVSRHDWQDLPVPPRMCG